MFGCNTIIGTKNDHFFEHSFPRLDKISHAPIKTNNEMTTSEERRSKILEKNIFSYENDFLTIHPLFMHYDFKATIAIAKKLSYVYRNRHMKLRHYG